MFKKDVVKFLNGVDYHLNMARPSKLTEKQKEEIIKRVLEGEKYEDIAREFGITKSAITHIKKKYGLALKKPEGETMKRVVREVTLESTARIDEVLDVGKYVIDRYKSMALAYGYTLKDFIDYCINFWDLHRGGIEALERELKKYKRLCNYLIYALKPTFKRIQQTKVLEKVMTAQMLVKGEVDPTLLSEFLNKIWGYENA